MTIPDRPAVSKSLMTAICLSLILFTFGPSLIYFTNPGEFSFPYSSLLWKASLLSLIFAALLTILFLLLRGFAGRAISVIVMVCILLSLQMYFLVWRYGLLNGTPIPWNEHLLEGIVDGALWIVAVVIAWVKFKGIHRYAITISISIVFFHIVSLGFYAAQFPESSASKYYRIDDSRKFVFSTDKNVIILLLDAFQTDLFQEIINQNPVYKEYFRDFVYFRNTLAGHPFTETSTMNILTGEFYDGSTTFEEFKKKAYTSTSIPKVLKENGWNVGLYSGRQRSILLDESIASNIKKGAPSAEQMRSDFAYLLDVALFRQLPTYLKTKVYNNQNWRFARHAQQFRWLINDSNEPKVFNPPARYVFSAEALERSGSLRFLQRMGSLAEPGEKRPVFKYFHFDLPHSPLRINERLEYETMAQTRRNFRRQCQAALQIVKFTLDELKKIHAYDNSMIFIIADHGAGAQEQTFSRQAGFPVQPGQSLLSEPRMINALPLFLVKRFHANADLKVSDAPVSLADIRPTIFGELGIRVSSPGKSIFEIRETESRTRRYVSYDGYDSSRDVYPNVYEWLVTGYSWIAESWRPSNRTFTSSGAVYKPPEVYKPGKALRFGTNGNALQYQTHGWKFSRSYSWMTGQKATLSIPIASADSSIECIAYVSPFVSRGRWKSHKVEILVNDQRVAVWNVTRKTKYRFVVRRDLLRQRLLNITFYTPDNTAGIGIKKLVLRKTDQNR